MIYKKIFFKGEPSKALNFLCLGGGSIIFLVISLLLSASSQPIAISMHKSYAYLFGFLIAGLVYQPHFIYSYYVNYLKNKSRSLIIEKSFSLFYVPIILGLILSLFFIDVLVFSFIPTSLIQVMLGFVLLMVSWHFSCQTVQCIFYYSKTKANLKVIKIFRLLFWATFIFGVLSCYIQLNDYPFYGLPIPNIKFLTAGDHLLLYFRIAFLSTHVCLALWFFSSLSLFSFLPWAAFLCWCLTTTFTKDFFYLVPLFHGLEIIPFFLKKNIDKSLLRIYGSILIVSLVLFFLMLQGFVEIERQLGSGYSRIFVAFLILLNFHHVLLEGNTWKNDCEN